MHGPYPGELRTRVIDFVEEGGSRREAAEQFEVSVSSAIRWMQRFRENGTFEPMPSGGSTSPLEKHSRQILAGGVDPGCWCKPPLLAAVFSGPQPYRVAVPSAEDMPAQSCRAHNGRTAPMCSFVHSGARSCGMHQLFQTFGL